MQLRTSAAIIVVCVVTCVTVFLNLEALSLPATVFECAHTNAATPNTSTPFSPTRGRSIESPPQVTSWWGTDVVLVVTQFNHSLEWMTTLPLDSLEVVLFIKGNHRNCVDQPVQVIAALVACHHVHNAAGREAHTIAQFLYTYYNKLPRVVFFLSDDLWQDHRFKPLRLAMAAGPDTFKRWLTLAEEDPFESVETCLCEIVIERGVWIPDSTYGNYAQYRWFMESFAHVDVERCVFTPKQIVIFPPYRSRPS